MKHFSFFIPNTGLTLRKPNLINECLFKSRSMTALTYLTVSFIVLSLIGLSSCTESESTSGNNVTVMNFGSALEKVNKLIEDDPNISIDQKLEARDAGQSGCSPASPAAGVSCITQQIVTTISLPSIAGCPACSNVTVGYKVRVCQNPLNPFDYSFTFWDFGVIPGCQDWWDCIGNLPGHEADRVIEAMSFQASLIIEQNYVSYWVNLINPNCPNSFFTSDFIRQSCFNWCIYPILPPPYWAMEQLICGIKCCQRTRTFCKELNGNITISSPSYQVVGTNTCSSATSVLCNGLSLPCYDRPCDTP